MSDPAFDRDDSRLRAALLAALASRDRAARAPRFAALWPSDRARAPSFLRPAFAALAVVSLIAGITWSLTGRDAGETEWVAATRLAEELSAPGYWRVPTDDLLAYAAPPLSAELPAPDGLEISLEESLL